MFEPPYKTMLAVDYVSMIRSLYADRRSQLLGSYGSAVAVALTWLESGSLVLLGVALAFVVVGALRNLDMLRFERTALVDDDVAAARKWERRATIGSGAIAALYGFWVLYSFLVVNTFFAELASLGVSMSVLVGVTARNFAVERVMTIQVMLICIPAWIGMLFDGHLFTALLSFVFLPYFASLKRVAGNIRAILLRAVHGRIEASRLASELDTALDTMQHGLCMIDGEGRITVANNEAEEVFASLLPGKWTGRQFEAMILASAGRGTIPQGLGAPDHRRGRRGRHRQGRAAAGRRAVLRGHRLLPPGQDGIAVRGHHRAREGRRAHQLHGALRYAHRASQPGLFHRAGRGRPRPQEARPHHRHGHADDRRHRRLQACQRHHGSPDRRPRAGRDLAAARLGAGQGQPRGAARRRRIRGLSPGRGADHRNHHRPRGDPQGLPRLVRGRGRGVLGQRLDRRCDGYGRVGRPRCPDDQGGPGALQGQGLRQGSRPGVPRRDGHRLPLPPAAQGRAQAGRGRGQAVAGLPADRRPPVEAGGELRGAGALAPSGARLDPALAVHPDRRGDRPHLRNQPLGAHRSDRRVPQLARGGLGLGQHLGPRFPQQRRRRRW